MQRDVRGPRETRLERTVELDGVDVPDALGQVAREDAEPGTDLEHDVVGVQVGEPTDHAENVLVDQEVLAELLLRLDHSENAADALASICASRSRWPRSSARAASVSTTLAGSFGLPRRGCGAR